MTERWAEVRAIFERVVDLPLEQRGVALAECCGEDAGLRAEVEQLLASDGVSHGLTGLAGRELGGLWRRFSPEDLVGLVVGGFRLTRVLAEGGMGVVFAAEQAVPRRTVAVKLLSAQVVLTDDLRRRFAYEAEVLALLRHPGIAQVYAAGTHVERGVELPWIAMELVEGARTLLDHARDEQLSVEGCVRLMREVCAAIQHGHGRGVIHRDLKPGNVLVDGAGRSKVIDFGIARAIRRGEGEAGLTQEGAIVGTLRYMAPEQLLGGDVDVRCDVYALGALLYELVCGRPAHDLADKPVPAAYRMLAEEPPAPPSAYRPGLPRELDWIALRAMERERESRYATVAALDDDLCRFLSHEPLVAGPRGALYRLRKFVRRHRIGVSTAAAAAVLILGALVLSTMNIVKAAREKDARLRLADSLFVAHLRTSAEDLYPAYPARIADMARWLADADGPRSRLPEYRGLLDQIEASGRATPGGGLEFADPQDGWRHETLGDIVHQLEDFYEPARGVWADVSRRFAEASTLAERTVTGADAAPRWSVASAAIEAEPLYRGLRVAPQVGLLPLGPDPASRLWEFLVVQTGAAPGRDDGGHAVSAPEVGVVLVLLPGGPYTQLVMDFEISPLLGFTDVPEAPVEIEPFFLSKWELTQAQWLRMTGESPSLFEGPTSPVERVSWRDCDLWLRRFGLDLPSVVQWGFALRAGNDGPWWFDALPDDLPSRENIGRSTQVEAVGGSPANTFGLHDLLGNVQEWTLNTNPADGGRCYLGGAYHVHEPEWFPIVTRSSYVSSADPNERYPYRGVRPMRALHP